MKRLSILLVIAVLFTGSIFAQERGSRSEMKNRQERPNPGNQQGFEKIQREIVKVEGIIKIEKDFIMIESGESKYFVPMFNRYIRSIEGIKDGAKVSVEGYNFRNMIHPAKAEIDGKSYIFVQPLRDTNQDFGKHRFDNRRDNRMQKPERKDFQYGNKMKPGRHGSGCNCR